MEGEWFCYRSDLFNGRGLVMLNDDERWPVYWRKNVHITEVAFLKEGEWSCYRGGKLNKGRMTMSERWSV